MWRRWCLTPFITHLELLSATGYLCCLLQIHSGGRDIHSWMNPPTMVFLKKQKFHNPENGHKNMKDMLSYPAHLPLTWYWCQWQSNHIAGFKLSLGGYPQLHGLPCNHVIGKIKVISLKTVAKIAWHDFLPCSITTHLMVVFSNRALMTLHAHSGDRDISSGVDGSVLM